MTTLPTELTDAIRRDWIGDLETPIKAITFFELRLAAVGLTIQPAPTDRYEQPTVTLAALFDTAALDVADSDWPAALALLDAIADHIPPHVVEPFVLYRDMVRAYQLLHVASVAGIVDRLRPVTDGLRGRVFDGLVRGPDAPPATGQETF